MDVTLAFTKRFGAVTAVDDVSLTLGDGEILALAAGGLRGGLTGAWPLTANVVALGFCNGVFGWDCEDALYDNCAYTGWHSGYEILGRPAGQLSPSVSSTALRVPARPGNGSPASRSASLSRSWTMRSGSANASGS